MQITEVDFSKLVVPCNPPITNSQITLSEDGVIHLTVRTNTGEEGIGLGRVPAECSVRELEREFSDVAAELTGAVPETLLNTLRFPGHGARFGRFRRAVDVALWDLSAKRLGIPLYELFGADDPTATAYVTGATFGSDLETMRSVYREFADLGFSAAKVKVGFPKVAEDIQRIRLVRDELGEDCLLAVDANLAWTPKETIRRAQAYDDAGLDILWIEDPVHYENLSGIKRIVDGVSQSMINVGEYVNFNGKRRLLEQDAADMINLRDGLLSESLTAAALANSYRVRLHVGNLPAEINFQLAAALSGDPHVEYWKRPWDLITKQPYEIEDGSIRLPDTPGHGISISEEALDKYGQMH